MWARDLFSFNSGADVGQENEQQSDVRPAPISRSPLKQEYVGTSQRGGATMGKSTAVYVILIAATLATSSACKRSAPIAEMKDALTEQNEDGSVSWEMGGDGRIRALVRSPSGEILKSNGTGAVTIKGEDGTQTVTLKQDPDTGLLVGQAAKLKGELTEVDYALNVGAKDWKGVLYVPEGGTAELDEGAKAASKVTVPEGKQGPHGGTIQVVGQDRIELVADPSSKEARVYVLDGELKQVPVGARKVKLAVVDDRPEVIVLTPEPGGTFLKGRVASEHDPIKITVSVTVNQERHVALVGYHPGAIIVVGSRAPRIHVMVIDGFRGPDTVVVRDDDDDDHRKIHVKVKDKGRGNKVHINVH
jgi:hypothetical protein